VRDLHVLGVTDDGQYLVLSETVEGGATFRIPVDGRLRSAVRGHLDDALLELRPGTELTPREIQARIRAGETVGELARASGLPEARIAAFAHPVLAERAGAVRDARAARVADSDHTMGEVIDDRLGAQDVDVDSVDWDAWRTADGRWAVQMVYRAFDRLHSASFIWDAQSRRVSPADPPAQSLLRGVPVVQPDNAPGSTAVIFGAPREVPPRTTRGAPGHEAAPPAQTELPMPEPADGDAKPAARRTAAKGHRRAAVPSWTQIRETARMPTTGELD
jgi:hypothetical protein